MCHGTPDDDYTYMLEEQSEGRLALARPRLLQERLGRVSAELVLCGHSHLAHMAMAPNGTLIVNPGSVGCPLFADNPSAALTNARAPHARYAVVTRRAGRWSADFHAVAYDWDRAAERAASNGRDAWAQVYRTGMI